MNYKLNKYINYLLENNPSPFCDYIISKELLKEDAQTVRGAYEWAAQFKLYKELADEQLPDGSYGGFDTAHTELVKAGRRKYKATARAISRMLDLSLDGIGDPMVERVIDVMKKYLSGELPDPEFYGKNNIYKPIGIRQQMIQNLGYFEPENNYVVELRNITAETCVKAYESSSFTKDIWDNIKYNFNGLMAGIQYSNIDMLSYGNVISEDMQRKLLAHEWESDGWGWSTPSVVQPPESKTFVFWIRTIERLQKFSLFGEFMAAEVEPHLYNICEQIINDRDNNMQIAINNYFYHHGQYTDTRNSVQKKKNDLLLQIIRILNNCGE